ncbi:glutathione S-transferase family protein [Stella sp.]|uniref:glutathione S-transferase family protein n=1 Tax=Stella sp. TaxID=2912054 RepID=UPI0035AF1424
MSVEIYWGSGSPYAWRVLLAAAARHVPYESRLLSFSAKEHKAPAFLAVNPRGKVPALKDGDRVVTESLAIMHHLDGLGSGPALFGASHAERTHILEWCSRIVSDLEEAVYGVARPLMFAKPDADTAGKVEAALPALHAELAGLETALAQGDWLAGGPAPSAADFAAFPFLKYVERAAGKEAARAIDLGVRPLAARYPRLAAWQARIEAMPGYERTYPPHWREG